MSKILDEYLGAAEFARQLNRAPATLERWRKRRIGPAPTMVGLITKSAPFKLGSRRKNARRANPEAQ